MRKGLFKIVKKGIAVWEHVFIYSLQNILSLLPETNKIGGIDQSLISPLKMAVLRRYAKLNQYVLQVFHKGAG